jgi:HAE1 family hydrophobic/amphiphilic exporter-1
MRRTVLILLMAALAAAAQPAAPPRVGVGVLKRELSLAQAVELALRHNLEVQIEKTGVSAAVESRRGAGGYLDPRFRWAPQVEDRTTPTSSPLIGTDGKLVERVLSQNFYFDQRLPWAGASLALAFENNRQSTTNPFVTLTPFLVSRLGATLTVPLTRNRRIDRERANLRIAATQVDLAGDQVELKVIDVIARVEEAYWNLVAARQSVEVAAEAVNLAREQLARTRRMIDSGTLAPVEIAAAEAELERRVDTWYAAIGQVTQMENALKLLITDSRDESLWNDEIIPTEVRTLEAPATDDLRAAVSRALAARIELRQLARQQQTNQVQTELAQNQTRPELNLIAGYYSSGLAGEVSVRDNPFSRVSEAQVVRLNELSRLAGLPPLPPVSFGGVPPDQIGGYGSVLDGVFRARYPTAFAGLQFNFTGRNRAAEAQLAQSAIAARRLELERARLALLIEAQVRNAFQSIQTARQRIAAAEASARAAEEKLASEIRLFQTGESTNFLVLTRQNELADSRQRVVAARLEFNKAVARAQQALGATLEHYNIRVE